MYPLAILVHVSDVEEGLAWYQKAFSEAKEKKHDDAKVKALELGAFIIELVEADAKVCSGKSGTVLYWWCDDLANTINHMISIGSEVYRGPIQIENGMSMCQVTDPFGNLIGLRGKDT